MPPVRGFIPKMYAPVDAPLVATADAAALAVRHLHAAGIAMGESEPWVAVPAPREPQAVRRFGAFRSALNALATWRMACGVTPVARDATGISWRPLLARLARRGLQVVRSEPRQAKRAPGPPHTAVLDCQRVQRLHPSGLLSGAWRPAEPGGVLRASLRQRQLLISCAAPHIPHRPKALQQLPLQLTQVVTELPGVPGMAILKALLAGERDGLT